MGSVIKSLKKLYKKMGGTNTKGINTVDGMVDKIAEKYEAGGSGGGSNNVFPLTVTKTLDSDGHSMSEQLDKTYGEILAALKNGMTPVIIFEIGKDENGTVVYENNNIFSIVTTASVDIMTDLLNDDISIVYTPSLSSGRYTFYETDGFESVEEALSVYPTGVGIGGSQTISPDNPGMSITT